jgi:guanosine-3',5'-bis(diphosphate) 3'-pyrophosphohydrolase
MSATVEPGNAEAENFVLCLSTGCDSGSEHGISYNIYRCKMMTTEFNQVASSPAFAISKIASLERNLTPSKMTLDDLLAETRQYLAVQDIEKIRAAYELAHKAHNGVVRRSGEPYIQHPLEVAFLLAGMRIDADGIVAALLHDVVEDTEYSLEDLRTQFGNAVATIVDGVTKFDALAGKPSTKAKEATVSDVAAVQQLPVIDKRRQRIETVRKMLVAMAEDPRVVVLKLADRLHNMRTLAAMTPTQQQNTARETSEIYVPLARRLGMARLQAELEDLALSYLDPETYQWLAREVEEEVERRRPYIEKVCQILQEEMERAGIHAEIHAWQKHLASVNRKLGDMPRQNVGEISQLHDLVSFRILVDSDHECYLALGHIHALWRPKDGRIKDFIATPKLNGYQSLHTTVFCLENRLADIQIRTHEMERIANYGIASYWYLKERMGKNEAAVNSWRLSYREMVAWIEQLREWQRELPQQSADEFVEAVKGDIFQEQIFVFTPKGEVKDLPRGSTPLDMAYRIHTDIGDHCAGARIITNQDDTGRLVTRLVPLDYELKGGEIVDIMVNRTVHPTRDWLSFARTAAARNKIRRYLKTYEREINLQLGRERLDLALKAAGQEGLTDQALAVFQQVYERATSSVLKKYANLDDIYVALGREDLQAEQVMTLLLPCLQQSQAQSDERQANTKQLHHYLNGHVEGQNSAVVKLASCCCPIPGDAIVGVFNPGKGMLVHRADCRSLRRYRNTSKALVEINWLQIEPETYQVPVTIVAHDRAGLLRDVAAVVADAGINMTSVTSVTQASLQKAIITATLEISAARGIYDQLECIFRRLRQVKNVVSVERALTTK